MTAAAAVAAALLLLHGLYVLLLPALGRAFGRPWRTGPFDGSLAVVIPARDEERAIAAKVANVRADLSAPSATRVIVIADGCVDRTAERAREAGAHVVEHADSGGKGRRLAELVPTLPEDVVAVTDATSRFADGTLGALLAPFADPEVGGATAVLSYTAEHALGRSTRGYFDAETRLRTGEALLAATTGFTGSLYAVRRELHRPADPRGNDDFQAALDVAIAGRRGVVAEGAVVVDDPHGSLSAELSMRRRVAARALRAIASRRELARRRPGVFLMVVVHKLVRFAALPLGALVLAGPLAAAAHSAAAGLLLSAGAVAAGLAAATLLVGSSAAALSRPAHLLLAQWAVALGALDFFLGRSPAAWRPHREAGA